MLHTLELHDFAIAERLELELAPGLNVLTGETGAGKSIVVDALNLLTGSRADAGMIRGGAQASLVQATFMDAPLQSAARRLLANGRHTARIDGELVTVAELAQRVGGQAAVFGQHAAQELQSAAAQRRQLDRLLDPRATAALRDYAQAFDQAARVSTELAQLREAQREQSRRASVLQFQLAEIDAVKPTRHEDDELRAELTALQHAERIAAGAAAAYQALEEVEPSAVALTAQALRDLQEAGRYAPQLAQLAHDLSEALAGLGAVGSELEAFLTEFQADPQRLDQVQGRLAALQGLERKYGPDIAAVLQFRATAAAELAALDNVGDDIARLEAQQAQLEQRLTQLGAELTAGRRQAAQALQAGVQPLLQQLGMPQARFQVELSAAARRQRHGADEVLFLFTANRGEAPLPVADVASGGELSRIMLALNLVTGSDLPTLAFDEVDAGVGGATAIHVAALLGRLARQHQVLVVTHLAQVAAFAQAHFIVKKATSHGRTITAVRRVPDAERPTELARMLSGSITEASLQHARELLDSAASGTPA